MVLKICAFESRTINSQNLEEDNYHWQSMCYETPLRFNRSLRQIFSRSGSPIMMKKYDKSALMHISQEFGIVYSCYYMFITCWFLKEFLKSCFLDSGLTKFFTLCNFRNKVGMAIILFFKMFKIWCRLQKQNEKIRKIFWF